MFAAGGLGSLRGAFATPDPRSLVVVVDGLAYHIDTEHPGGSAAVVHDQFHQVVASVDPTLLLLVRFIDIVASAGRASLGQRRGWASTALR